jgi:pyruvate dehydrogenase E2 component (dihydrolipoamide acetyltransferase)/2-oxoisovalerate dehydrogenase E2 component (dihydrolipoyl transacylase)
MDFRLPELGEGVYEAEVVTWLVKPGDSVKRGQSVLEVLTDKATMEVPAPFHGTITALQAEPGKQIQVGQVILTYEPAARPEAGPPEPAPAKKTEPAPREPAAPAAAVVTNGPTLPPGRPDLPVKAAPSVRLLAHKLGIDLTRVRGTGPQGRILVGDLTPQLSAPAAGARPAAEPRPDYGTPGTRIKLQGVRRKIADHLVHAKRTIPHYTYVDECDVTEMVRLRQGVRDTFAHSGVKLTYLAFVVKAVAAALKEVPLINASLDEAAEEIVLHDHYHVGIAVATPNGLIVPVIRDADQKDLAQVAREAERLSEAARTGKVKREELLGGTFTITSIGGIGGLFSTPVINHPEVGILGVGKVVKRPVYDEAGNVKPADLVYLSLSLDHRVVDGAVGAAFANAVIRRLQNPAALLLPEKLI